MEQEQKFIDFVEKGKVLETFGFGKLADIAYKIFERVPDDTKKEEADEAVISSLNDELIYRSDQWEVIAAYSNPDDPLRLADACELFLEDLMQCID